MGSFKDEQAVLRAAAIKQLLESEILIEGFEKLRRLLTDKMIHSPLDKPQVREQARYQLEALGSVEVELKHVLETGKLIIKKEDDEKEMDTFFDKEP
jgi:hypothetical protein